ncbi:MAG: hypothetical protein IT357_04305 [Gemmatimonadaceae bacterium]|nr:hypothetical protein [Gemmatimonadaceae bacterium]
MYHGSFTRSGALLTAAVLALSACESNTSPNANAAIRFSSPAVAGQSTTTTAGGSTGLSIVGTNGTLVITDIKLVVDEFELKRVESIDGLNCDDLDDSPSDDDDCSEFESRIFVADVPLGSGTVTVANDRIPAGTYDEMEFEVKDLFVDSNDDDDVARAARIAEVLASLRQTYTDWPAGASLMVEGTFTPTGGVAQSFRVYFDADVEVETDLFPALVIDDASTGVEIALRPDLWFKRPNGTVVDLAALNYATTSMLAQLEVEFENGMDIEIDD